VEEFELGFIVSQVRRRSDPMLITRARDNGREKEEEKKNGNKQIKGEERKNTNDRDSWERRS